LFNIPKPNNSGDKVGKRGLDGDGTLNEPGDFKRLMIVDTIFNIYIGGGVAFAIFELWSNIKGIIAGYLKSNALEYG
jgi:hypothetical protein